MDQNPPKKFHENGDGVIVEHKQDPPAVAADANSDDHKHNVVEEPFPSPVTELSLVQALEDVDRFLESSTNTIGKSNPLEVPSSVESLLTIVEKGMVNFDPNSVSDNKKGASFWECLSRISKLINVFNDYTHDPIVVASLNRASTVLHLVMSVLDGGFRMLLDSCNGSNSDGINTNNADYKNTPKASKQSSFCSHIQDADHGGQSESARSTQDEEFPAYSPEAITGMHMIANCMISLGYGSECCMAYSMIRRNAFNYELDKLGFSTITIEDVQRMHWETLGGEIVSWIDVLKHCSSVLFAAEQNLCDSVFKDHPSISQRMFSDLALATIFRFLNFAEAVALTKRSAEKLFKFLDMYEALRDMNPAIDNTHSDELKSEISTAKRRLAEAAVSIFCELENSIRRDHGKTPVPSGAVHPLTRYTMNYLEYACEYKDTLEQVFQEQKTEGNNDYGEIKEGANDDGTPKTSPFAVQLNTIMDLLDLNLEMKSKLYKDPALRYVFLMNNGRYILQKIRGSNDINDIMGARWYRRRTSELRRYHKGYTRVTWGRLLQCLSHEGLQVNGKVVKPVLKERFKMFNSTFDEIHKTQSTWVVSDEQLQSELRVSVSAVVIPAYRSFIGRFQQYLSAGRQTEKYIKYQPEDIENLIEELFDGNPNSMVKRRS